MHQIVAYLVLNNGWSSVLNDDLRGLTQRSILEAGLVHFRCVIEFLGNNPDKDRVVARDYLGEAWTWRIKPEIGSQVADLHGRVAHIGFLRTTKSGFLWTEWLAANVRIVLRGFRDFLELLREMSPARYERFAAPRPGFWIIDLDLLNSLVPKNDTAASP